MQKNAYLSRCFEETKPSLKLKNKPLKSKKQKTMKKLCIAAMAIVAFASCSKEENNIDLTNGSSAVSISFVEESQTRAFFGSESAEAWEKSLNKVIILAFNPSGNLLVQRQFTSAEVTSKTVSFTLPNTSAGDKCEFYAVANLPLTTIATKTQLFAVLENSATAYNGTFAEVTTKTKRAEGFVMSGNIAQTIAAEGSPTNIAITLKRTVAKLAIEAVQSADFSNRYSGAVRVNSANLTKGASQTLVLKPTTPSTGAMSFSHTQPSNVASNKYQNLFYLFENGTLASGNRVAVELQATYDIDGNFATTTDQTPITYIVELDGTTGGAIQRNGYYKLQVAINGLTGNEASVSITVADWEVPTTQTINVGQ